MACLSDTDETILAIAVDTLTTTYVGATSRTITVTVTAPNGVTGSVTVQID